MKQTMNKDHSITPSQYRAIDLFLLTLVCCVLEAVNIKLFDRAFSDQLFCLSVIYPMSLIVMQRWGAYGAITTVAGSLTYCLLKGDASAAEYLIYTVGSCLILLNLIWYRFTDKNRITSSAGLRILFCITGYLFMCLGRTFVSLFFMGDILGNLAAYLMADALNAVVGMIVVSITARPGGVFEDQKTYLERLASETAKDQ